jgi:hypothetical protein
VGSLSLSLDTETPRRGVSGRSRGRPWAQAAMAPRNRIGARATPPKRGVGTPIVNRPSFSEVPGSGRVAAVLDCDRPTSLSHTSWIHTGLTYRSGPSIAVDCYRRHQRPIRSRPAAGALPTVTP